VGERVAEKDFGGAFSGVCGQFMIGGYNYALLNAVIARFWYMPHLTPPSAGTAPVVASHVFDVTVIGGGPVGLFAAFYAGLRQMTCKIVDSSNIASFRSFGLELLADFHIFRIPYMISAGVQSAWKNLNEKPSLELLFNIDLYGMTIGRRQM
jgi:hypothetical protein